ncbi:hypothetical protein KFK09_021180 [Dendrobium nobile]|uniref:Uncharacterized protein n=1 Tax=Dendrobium nobile TaxID=94219 RepID=A0A8T3APE4_DENNO|nr:hypothetical protein KFK09_021180 [Dendrobium nobile]
MRERERDAGRESATRHFTRCGANHGTPRGGGRQESSLVSRSLSLLSFPAGRDGDGFERRRLNLDGGDDSD